MILVPVKNLADAKQRLASVLTSEERFALAQAMCEDVLQTLASWQRRPAVSIVTSDSFARDLAARFNFNGVVQVSWGGEHFGGSGRYSVNRRIGTSDDRG